MAKLTAQEFAEKWGRNTSAAVPDYVRGIGRVTESPTAKAAAAIPLMLARITEAANSGKIAAGLNRVSLPEWKAAASEKGSQRIASGVAGAQTKMVSFATQLLPFEDNLRAQIETMPKMSLEDRIARSAAWQRGMHAFQRS